MVAIISDEAGWRRFESDRWRDAVRDRGLQLSSLDSDERLLVFDAITSDLERRKTAFVSARAHHVIDQRTAGATS